MQKKIHIIITGGTIDSYYYPPQETSVPNEKTIIPEYVSQKIKPHNNVSYEEFSMLDSGEITDKLRAQLVQSISNTDAQSIIITHGTNTMQATAEYLAHNIPNIEKTIILTGSMIPLKEFAMSDGGFNLGYAMAQAQIVQGGVYIAMNAQLFKAGNVTKDTSVGRFEFVQNA